MPKAKAPPVPPSATAATTASSSESDDGVVESSVLDGNKSNSDDSDSEESNDNDDDDDDDEDEEMRDRLARFSAIRRRIRQSETDNRKDLVDEQNSKRLPMGAQKRLDRKRKDALKLLEKREVETSGGDYDRHRNLGYSIQDVEEWEKVQVKKRQRANTEYFEPSQSSHKKYRRLTDALTPDLEAYRSSRIAAAATGEEDAFYGSTDVLDIHARPAPRDLDRMVTDLNKQIAVRGKSSRRRAVDPDEDVSYINDKNRNFNRKIARAYDKYTTEIKESLERGTAL
ncbi:SYF2 splicing factor-domain-containing protein [Blastocladiella britannica]|nr:SYF2 splicing factor-domain-containing protein [Blastocladiella britannica]